jgi:hypothetical protein
MDLVTVTCTRDFEQMILQAHSIDVFLTRPCRHWVFVEDQTTELDTWRQALSPWYKKHKLELLPARNYDIPGINTGWDRQQLIKMEAAKFVRTKTYLVLDSKNFFVKPTNLYNWPVSEGNNLIYDIKRDQSLIPWLTMFCEDRNLSFSSTACEPVTPFRLNTDIVLKLLDFDVSKIFSNPTGGISEFVLYSLYSQSQGQQLPEGPTTNVTIYDQKILLSDDAAVFEDMHSWPLVRQLGLHRSSLENLPRYPQVFCQWLAGKGLELSVINNVMQQYI